MDKRMDIVSRAAEAFEGGGFRGIGIDQVLAPAGISTRTLYKRWHAR